jgi:hypothetical protein
MSLVSARLRVFMIAGLGVVVAAAAARPLHHELKPSQGAAVLFYVVPAAFIPALLVRYAMARRWVLLLALIAVAFVAASAAGFLGALAPQGALRSHSAKATLTTQSGGQRAPSQVPLSPNAHQTISLSSTLIVALFLLAGLVIVVAIVIAVRRTPPAAPQAPVRKLAPPKPEEVKRLFYSLVKDSLDDLRAEPDPRRAVIAAYARMERGLGTLGTERIPSETPFEYLRRVLERVSVSDDAARTLTDLFQRAKFSPAPVDEAMKAEAVAALEAIQEEARAWAA